MSDFVYSDYIPANARILINYNKEDKVKFVYPREWTYWKAVWKCAYTNVLNLWLTLHVVPTFYLLLYIGLPYVTIGAIFFDTTITNVVTYSFRKDLLFIFIASLYLFGIPALVTYYLARDKDRLSKWNPKIGYWSQKLFFKGCEKIYTPKDAYNNRVLLPNFSNVYLKYKAEGDFNRYLERVEIIEIPFEYVRRRTLFPWIKKVEHNDYEFSALFHFNKQPKNGCLRVEFI